MKYKYIPFIGLCLGFFIVMMDTTTVPFIYTTLMKEFHLSPNMVAWVNNSYLVTYAAFLILGGKLGDCSNRKVLILIAYLSILFGAAISGLGQTFAELVFGRVLMGVGAGLIAPQSMVYISMLFAKGNRGTALGIWGSVAGVATAMGPVITQILLSTASWHWVMWINIPVAFACIVIGAVSLPKETDAVFIAKDTLVGLCLGVLLFGAIIGLQFKDITHLPNPSALLMFILGLTSLISLIAFIVYDLKKEHGYFMSLKIWKEREFFKICTVSGLLGASVTAFYLPIAFILNISMNFGPVAISILMITISLSSMLIGPYAGYLSDRVFPEKIIQLGLILFALANVSIGITAVVMHGGDIAFSIICLSMVLAGVGTGLCFSPLANLALGKVKVENISQAMAFYNFLRQTLSAGAGIIIALIFNWIVQFQLGNRFKSANLTLRQFPLSTAIAALVCFIIVALSLSLAVYLMRSNTLKIINQDIKQ